MTDAANIKLGRTASEDPGASPNQVDLRPTALPWHLYTVPELVQFMDEIRATLPPLALKDLNLEEQLLMQLAAMRAFQATVFNDKETAVNQVAQVANSVASVLKQLSDAQVRIYSSERFKRIESLMIRTLKKLPEEQASAFLDEYDQLLASMDNA